MGVVYGFLGGFWCCVLGWVGCFLARFVLGLAGGFRVSIVGGGLVGVLLTGLCVS